MDEENLKSIDTKMSLMLKLLALNIVSGKQVNEQISLLHNAGITPKDIAEILGKTQQHVNTTLYKMRKSKKETDKNSTTINVKE